MNTKALSIILFILVSLTSLLFSAILTVDNRYPCIGQYTTFQAAHDAAANGDIIYLYPSSTSYGDIIISKSLQIYGGGWGRTVPNEGVYGSTLGGVTFEIGSENSSINGVECGTYNIMANSIQISNCSTGLIIVQASNVVIDKNKVSAIDVRSNQESIVITKNLFTGYVYIPNTWQGYTQLLMQLNSSIQLHNNVFLVPSIYYCWGMWASSNCSCYLVNNTFSGTGYASIRSDPMNEMVAINNIIVNGIDANQTFWTFNIIGGDLAALFVDAANGDFHLAPGSPAIGAGEGGIDCGAYGGPNPFDDTYNTPPLPTIIKLTTPLTIVDPADGPMPVEIRATTSGN